MSYLTIDRIIEQNDASISAAEAHGIAVGLLCMDANAGWEKWLSDVFEGDVDLSGQDRNSLIALFEQTGTMLESEGFEFDLFLPEDDEPFVRRVEGLRDWCRGFLLGVGFSGSSGKWSGECGEILKDMVEFTRIDSDAGGEEDEKALAEVSEYVRVGVQLLKEALREGSSSGVLH
ncbi:MAG: UPF0149 family protein [Gammaproteobacteria bacterium]